MREIKFRAFYDGTMIQDAARVNNALYWKNKGYQCSNLCAFSQADPAELMQYTGLKDRNGTEIYEGDIIRKEMCAPDDMAYGFYGEVGTVEYYINGMRYVIRRDDDDTVVFWDIPSCEIIGNIYENPELLDVES